MIRIYYRDRDRGSDTLQLAIQACEEQINLGPKAGSAFRQEYPESRLPMHTGFEQLTIIREKEKDYAEAIRLSQEAMAQGWNGDWEKRIARCIKRMGSAVARKS